MIKNIEDKGWACCEHPLVAHMREKSKSDNQYDKFSALLFALQIPSICSRIEFSKKEENTKGNSKCESPLYEKNGRPLDKNLYLKWLKTHRQKFVTLYVNGVPLGDLCEMIYGLRNDMTHAGSFHDLNNKLILVDSYDGVLCSGHMLYLSVENFCGMMFDAASETFSSAEMTAKTQILSSLSMSEIERMLDKRFEEFWAARNDDLRLYQFYCQSITYGIDKIEEQLDTDVSWTIDGLTREESERLVQVIHECDDYGDALNDEVIKKYLQDSPLAL